jgi:hypothetical protein
MKAEMNDKFFQRLREITIGKGGIFTYEDLIAAYRSLYTDEEWVRHVVISFAVKALESGRLSEADKIRLPMAHEKFVANFSAITADKNAKTVDREAAIRAIDAAFSVAVFGGGCDDETIERLWSTFGGGKKAAEMRKAKSDAHLKLLLAVREALKQRKDVSISLEFAGVIRSDVRERLGLAREGDGYPSTSAIKGAVRKLIKRS